MLEAEIIYTPTLSSCKPYLGGNFKFCKAPSISLPLDPISSNIPSNLMQLPIKLSLSMKLSCQTNPSNQPVDIAIGGSHFNFLASKDATVETLEYTTTAIGLTKMNYVISPLFTKEATIYKNCKMEILSHTSVPDIEVLAIVSSELKKKNDEIESLFNSLEEAADLPAQWAALRVAPETIDGLIANLDIQKMAVSDDISKITAKAVDLQSAEEKAQKRVLEDQIFQIDSQISDLSNLSSDIKSSLKTGVSCSSGSAEAFCVEGVQVLVQLIKEKVLLQRHDIESFNAFIESEVERLNLVASEFAEKLKSLVLK